MKKNSENILFITVQEAEDSGISRNTIYQASTRNSRSMKVIKDWENANYSLIEYESLKDSYKKLILDHFGNPYDYVAREPIKQMVRYDEKAEQFFYDYRYDVDKPLPLEIVKDYATAASWLNMVISIDENKKALKDRLHLKLDEFYTHVSDLIKINDIKLPYSYRALRAKMKEYKESGYEVLISKKWGNSNSAKVKDDTAKDLLVTMCAHPLQYDNVFIKLQYNKWAKENDYKEIKADTVDYYRKKYEAEIAMKRDGNAALKGKYLKQSKGFRPSQPLYLVESDDNHMDLVYTVLAFEGNKKNDFQRYKAIVVTDSFNDYPLGYAYSLNLTSELVRAAYAAAMHHIKAITGHWVLPHEVKTDRWALKELTPFYESMGKYFPTPVGSKNRGYIENFFGSPHWKRCMKAGANNYTGNNITAKNAGVNREWVDQQKANRPLIGEQAYDQIDQFFHRLRYMETSKGISKHDEWMNAWEAMPETDKRIISDEQYLLKFGIEHNYRGKGIEITNRGVEPCINGMEYSFDLENYDISLIGKKVSVLYDPNDMSRVLITDHDRVRMMAHNARLNPRALKDHSFSTRTYLNSIHEENRNIVDRLATRTAEREENLRLNSVSAEDILLNLSAPKELKQEAEVAYITQNTQNANNNHSEATHDEDLWDRL